jgi:hypothetical protein
VLLRVEVVADVAGLGCVDGVVTTHAAIFTREPEGSALPENDASRYHVLAARALRSETLAGGITRVSIGCSLGGV